MRTALENFNPITLNAVNESVYLIDPSAMVAGEIALQRFGFTDPKIAVPINIEDQSVDAF